MRSFRTQLGPASVLLVIVSFTQTRASATDSCKPVFDALMKTAATPNHSFTTTTGVSGETANEAETIFANGQKYIRVRGKWLRIPVTSQDVAEQEKEKEQHGTSTCQFLRTEPVNGDPAMLFSMHREYEEINEDGKVWVSKNTGLLLRAEEDVENRGTKVKEHRLTRFEYDNVRPPM